jgi:hypothetical protein
MQRDEMGIRFTYHRASEEQTKRGAGGVHRGERAGEPGGVVSDHAPGGSVDVGERGDSAAGSPGDRQQRLTLAIRYVAGMAAYIRESVKKR